MKQETAKHLMTTLADLADVYNARQPSQGALRIWKQALEGLDDKDIVVALNTWADHNRKMPTPAELREVVFKEQSRRLEREAEIRRAEEHRGPTRAEMVNAIADPHTYEAVRKSIRYIEYCTKSEDPTQWRWNLILAVADGKIINAYQKIFLEQQVLHHPLKQSDIDEARRHIDPYPIEAMHEKIHEFFRRENVSFSAPPPEEFEDVPF